MEGLSGVVDSPLLIERQAERGFIDIKYNFLFLSVENQMLHNIFVFGIKLRFAV
jgi:hypothetical protein